MGSQVNLGQSHLRKRRVRNKNEELTLLDGFMKFCELMLIEFNSNEPERR